MGWIATSISLFLLHCGCLCALSVVVPSVSICSQAFTKALCQFFTTHCKRCMHLTLSILRIVFCIWSNMNPSSLIFSYSTNNEASIVSILFIFVSMYFIISSLYPTISSSYFTIFSLHSTIMKTTDRGRSIQSWCLRRSG